MPLIPFAIVTFGGAQTTDLTVKEGGHLPFAYDL